MTELNIPIFIVFYLIMGLRFGYLEIIKLKNKYDNDVFTYPQLRKDLRFLKIIAFMAVFTGWPIYTLGNLLRSFMDND